MWINKYKKTVIKTDKNNILATLVSSARSIKIHYSHPDNYTYPDNYSYKNKPKYFI
jgi:hypothetical protein